MKKILSLAAIFGMLVSGMGAVGAENQRFDYFEQIDKQITCDLNCDGVIDTLQTDLYSDYFGCYSLVINGKSFAFDMVRHGHYSDFFIVDIDENDKFLDIVMLFEYKGVYGEVFRYDGENLLKLQSGIEISGERDYEIYWEYLENINISAGGGVLKIECGPESFVYDDFSGFEICQLTEEEISGTFDEWGGLYSVIIDGNKIEFDQKPVNKNDRILVPIRAIFEAMGYSVEWDEETKTAESKKGDNRIIIRVGDKNINYSVNGVDGVYECDTAPQIISGRTLIPLRGVAESAGCTVEWDELYNQAMIYTK